MNIDSNITEFFKPNRQVWQDAGLDAGVDIDPYVESEAEDAESDAYEQPEGEGISWSQLGEDIAKGLRAADFAERAKDVCDLAVNEGKNVVEQHICKLKEADQLSKVVELGDLMNELGENIFPELKGIDDPLEKYKKLQDFCDVDRLMQSFSKAVSYEVRPYKNSKERDAIIFTYKDGKKETVDLELNTQQIKEVFGPIFKSFLLAAHNVERKARASEGEKHVAQESLTPYQNYRYRMEKLKDRCTYLTSPGAAYAELMINTDLPEDLALKLESPLSKIAELWSNTEFVDVKNGDPGQFTLQFGDKELRDNLFEEVTDIIEEYYGIDYEDLDLDIKDNLLVLGITFGYPVGF
ncbi:hypothetical protein KKA95_04210 [Patescibacteria group bacterium]|nr:hypothetical protein [Patescibacteria group bacterium]